MKFGRFFTFLFFCVLFSVAWASQNGLNIQIQGLQGDELKNAQASLKVLKDALGEQYTQLDVQHIFRIAPREIKKAIAPFGYFHPIIKSNLSQNQNAWQMLFTVNPGEVVHVSHIDVRVTGPGSADAIFQNYLKKLPIEAGDQLNTKQYEAIKRHLFDLALANGYFQATMKRSKLVINLYAHKARIVIHFDTGPGYYFGKTKFPKVSLKEKLLKRYLPYEKGQHYRNEDVQKLQQDLVGSGYFKYVNVEPHPHRAERYYVPVDIFMKTQKPRVYNLGVGVGTDTGPRVLLGVNFRRLNSYGNKLNLTLLGSLKNRALVANYIIPGKHPATDQFFISAGYGYEDRPLGEGQAGKLSAGYTWLWHGWQSTASLAYLQERYNIQNKPKTHTHMLIPAINFEHLKSDDIVNPTKGYRVIFNLQGAQKKFLSEESFVQGLGSIKALYTLWKNWRILGRTQIAHTVISDLYALPLSLQLFAGGAQSVRGYGYESLGPGRNLITASLELQRRIYGDFYLAGFYDAGNVSNKWLSMHLNRGIGGGIVWVSPIGSLEVTMTQAVDYQGKPWRIQFTMGPAL